VAAVLCRLLLLLLLLGSTQGIAADYELPLDIGNGAFKSCSGTGPTYTCTGKVDIKGGDTVVLTGDITLIVNGEFKVGGGNVNNSGFVFNVTAEKINIEGPGPVVMNELTASGDITVHKAANLTGNLLSTGGDITIDNGNKDPGGNTVNGNIETQTGGVYISGGDNTVDGNIIANGGGGPLLIDNNSIVTGTCNPDHPQCNGGPGPGSPPRRCRN